VIAHRMHRKDKYEEDGVDWIAKVFCDKT